MGLDMYLYASGYESKHSRGGEVIKGFYPEELSLFEEKHQQHNFLSKETKYQIGYWRKFNALHNYIVKNFANGVDDCKEIYLPKEGIEQILEVLKTIKKDKSKANELLATQSGFFFGSTEYDEYYWQDIDYSIELFEDVLTLHYSWDIYYQASW